MLDEVIRLAITVRDPVPTNHAYGPRPGGIYMTAAGKAFKSGCAARAAIAKANSKWPRDLFEVAHVRLSYQLYDYEGDTDGPCKLIRDSLEGVLYINDEIVEDGSHPLSITDGNGRRVYVVLELLATYTKEKASMLRAKYTQRKQKSLERRAKRKSPARKKRKMV